MKQKDAKFGQGVHAIVTNEFLQATKPHGQQELRQYAVPTLQPATRKAMQGWGEGSTDNAGRSFCLRERSAFT